jgi:hypothetical protein
VTSNEVPESRVDLETVQDEVSVILATMSWTRAQLEDVKAELVRWMRGVGEDGILNPDLIQQHDAGDDPLDHAILAEHERVADEPA